MPAQAGFTFELEGLEELDKMLQELPKSMGRSVMRKVLRKAAKPTEVAAKANVPKGDTGNLQDSIGISSRLTKNQRRHKSRNRDEVEVYVGSNAPHAHLVEFGTQERFRGAQGARSARTYTGGSTGIMPANPFLTRAWDATKRKALVIIRDELAAELPKAAARLLKRAQKGTLGKRAVQELIE